MKLDKIRKLILEKGADALLITNKYNLRYATNFSGSTALALITTDKAFFYTDFRYIEQASFETIPYGFEIVEIKKEYLKELSEHMKFLNIHKLLIENEDITLSYFEKLKKLFLKVEFSNIDSSLTKLRMIKTEDEISTIKKAINIAELSFKELLQFVKPGIKESELSNQLEYIMKLKGASDKSFDIIIASGHRSAMPHGVASDKILEKNEFVKFDFGCYYKGYVSDITRTIFLGSDLTEKHKEIYYTVLEAQKIGLQNAKAGIKATDLDKIVRDFISSKGYKDNFGHGLGHGIGLEIHESPSVSHKGDTILEENMVITIEPGIYIPGFGGVRIEDDVVIKKDSCEILSTFSKELIII